MHIYNILHIYLIVHLIIPIYLFAQLIQFGCNNFRVSISCKYPLFKIVSPSPYQYCNSLDLFLRTLCFQICHDSTFHFEFQADGDELRHGFIRAWDRIHKAGPHELGPKTSLPMESYYRWVRIRAQKVGMPYEAVRPIILEIPDGDGVPPTILPPQIPTDVDTLKRS